MNQLGPRVARLSCTVVLAAMVFARIAVAPVASTERGHDNDRDQHWVATWGASPVDAPLDLGFTDQTVRLIVHTSIGGEEVRVRLSNTFGADSLVIGAAHIALQDSDAAIVPGSDRALSFGGQRSTTIPPGALVVSDPVELDVPALSNLAVSIYVPGPTTQATWHRVARQTNYVSTPGDFTDATLLPVDQTVNAWFYLTDVEVKASEQTHAIVTLGDSITDGFGSSLNANHRWPNFLADRLLAHHIERAVVDEGISGNRILHDVTGQNTLARLDRDALTQTGVRYLTVLLGLNDIGLQPAVTADEIIAGHQQIITRAHSRGLEVFGCTLTPFEGAVYFTPEGEAKRQAVNDFIRTSGVYDGVIDFDAATRDPDHPIRILPAYDSGDHLHPNDDGYQGMANAIELTLFRRDEHDDR
jgi:lysophospholipase L1-like esterase